MAVSEERNYFPITRLSPIALKGQFTQITNNTSSLSPLAVSRHTDSSGFMCRGFDVFASEADNQQTLTFRLNCRFVSSFSLTLCSR